MKIYSCIVASLLQAVTPVFSIEEPPVVRRGKPASGDVKRGLVSFASQAKHAYKNGLGSQQAGKILTVGIERATGLCDKDYLGTSDTYVIVKVDDQCWFCGSEEGRTETVGGSLDPVWDEEFRFLIPDEADALIEIEVWDHDPLNSDDRIAFLQMEIEDHQDFSQSFTKDLQLDMFNFGDCPEAKLHATFTMDE